MLIQFCCFLDFFDIFDIFYSPIFSLCHVVHFFNFSISCLFHFPCFHFPFFFSFCKGCSCVHFCHFTVDSSLSQRSLRIEMKVIIQVIFVFCFLLNNFDNLDIPGKHDNLHNLTDLNILYYLNNY